MIEYGALDRLVHEEMAKSDQPEFAEKSRRWIEADDEEERLAREVQVARGLAPPVEREDDR